MRPCDAFDARNEDETRMTSNDLIERNEIVCCDIRDERIPQKNESNDDHFYSELKTNQNGEFRRILDINKNASQERQNIWHFEN